MQSIRRAHANVKPGKLHVNKGELLGANANRSPSAYLHNPEEERARYQHDTDKIMTQLSVTDSEGKGALQHFRQAMYELLLNACMALVC